MNAAVPCLSVAFMLLSALGGVAIPVALFLYFRKRKKADVPPFFVGCAVMVLFAFVLESLFHRLVLSFPAGQTISGNVWLYALYGGLAAGLFEESGRFLAFRTVLRKYRENDADALMYGAGHGGIEAVVLLSLSMVSNIVISLLVNSGQSGLLTAALEGEELRKMEEGIRTLITAAPGAFLAGLIERASAVTLHLACSVLVWFGAKEKRWTALYPAAILLHALMDFIAALLSRFAAPVAVTELALAVFAVLTALLARAVWKKLHTAPAREPADGGTGDGI